MAKQVIPSAIDSLPLWDSFEAIFFLFAGISIGVVLGILFPSLWRTFRRRFRKETQYTPFLETWHDNSNLNLQILKDENEDTENEISKEKDPIHLKMIEAFVMARYFFETGQTRLAIQTYLEILGSENVSKQETNRVLFELSQVYFSMGLLDRAFDTGFELLNRKPMIPEVLLHLLDVCQKGKFQDKFTLVLNTYHGPINPMLRKSVSYHLSQIGENALLEKEFQKAIDFARLSANWNRTSAKSLVLLWQATSQIFWKKNATDAQLMWVAIAADLDARAQIYSKTKISPAAGAEYLCRLIQSLCKSDQVMESFPIVQKEFQKILEWKKLDPEVEKKLLESIFYAIILIQDRQEVSMKRSFSDVVSILTNEKKHLFYSDMFFSKSPSKSEALGFFAHECGRCRSQFVSFLWKCPECAADESLAPILSPLLE